MILEKIKKKINKFIFYISNKNLGIINILFIKIYILIFKININEYEKNINEYNSFNDFFCRKLKNNRIINNNNNIIISPVDGLITKIGKIDYKNNVFIKGKNYSLYNIVQDINCINYFNNGNYIIIYLSPSNYHRIHMIYNGFIKKMIYTTGNLNTVNTNSYLGSYSKLFQNERVSCLLKTNFGYVLKIFIGSIIVGNIYLNWHGIVNKNYSTESGIWDYNNNGFFFKKGDEIGKFMLGSSIMLIFQNNKKIKFYKNIKENNKILFGDILIKM
ncbi:phosphatidylserine decarboxylase proenzyme [endosymbiont of Euscepes postfasciatus]|uniref:archaetidylserine decarboxylase n=1 Tax=endosymbiont of Euscepes postfasciatus TaxID=650377 RepID=UPI000DC6E7CE|nr:archaetidylserine decarboxylase [endosymbiont of Euscepes postfasciatus]BBA84586.1 phosphatidylserine decarboxylase proenzyme [endosymbiont of Euscepes postfasciatus]